MLHFVAVMGNIQNFIHAVNKCHDSLLNNQYITIVAFLKVTH